MKDDWHPYPAEEPPEYGFYLTCRKLISVQRHFIYWWNPARSAFYRDCEKVTDVAAWMLLPEPYDETPFLHCDIIGINYDLD